MTDLHNLWVIPGSYGTGNPQLNSQNTWILKQKNADIGIDNNFFVMLSQCPDIAWSSANPGSGKLPTMIAAYNDCVDVSGTPLIFNHRNSEVNHVTGQPDDDEAKYLTFGDIKDASDFNGTDGVDIYWRGTLSRFSIASNMYQADVFNNYIENSNYSGGNFGVWGDLNRVPQAKEYGGANQMYDGRPGWWIPQEQATPDQYFFNFTQFDIDANAIIENNNNFDELWATLNDIDAERNRVLNLGYAWNSVELEGNVVLSTDEEGNETKWDGQNQPIPPGAPVPYDNQESRDYTLEDVDYFNLVLDQYQTQIDSFQMPSINQDTYTAITALGVQYIQNAYNAIEAMRSALNENYPQYYIQWPLQSSAIVLNYLPLAEGETYGSRFQNHMWEGVGG